MNTYYINNNVITCDLFDFIESDTTESLLAYTPIGKILGIAKDTSTLYFFDGTEWIAITSNISTSATVPEKVVGFILQEGNEVINISWNSSSTALGYKVYFGTSGDVNYSGTTTYTNYSLSGLTNNQLYSVYVYAFNEIGNSLPTSGSAMPVADIVGQVTNIQIDSYDTSSVSLRWNPVQNATNYKVYMTPENSSEVVAANPSTNSVKIGNLVSNTIYSFTVAAVSIAGEGQESSTVIQKTSIDLPDVPELQIAAAYDKLILSWNLCARAQTYDLYKGTTSANMSLLTNVSGVSYSDTTVTSAVQYFYKVVSKNVTGISESNIVSAELETEQFNEYSSSVVSMSFSGMISDSEYEDYPPMTESGKTYSTSLNTGELLTSGYYDYVDITFANLRSVSATGMKLYVKENNPWIEGGVQLSANYTGNISTGWISAAIDIEPAESDMVPKFKTFRMNLGTTAYNGNNDIIMRFYVPYSTSAGYGRTYTTCGAAVYNMSTVIDSYSNAFFGRDNNPNNDGWKIEIFSKDGNVTELNQVFSTNAWNGTSGDFGFYLPPNPTAIPWFLAKWHNTNAPKKIIEMVGDSIMQGYGDGYRLSVGGITERAKRYAATKDRFEFINFGQSGFTPEQYLARWYGYAKQTSGSALVYSIFSPNGYYDNGIIISSRIESMKVNCLLAEQYAKECGRVFIPCFITNTNMYQLNITPAGDATTNNTQFVKELLDWAISFYGNRLINLQPAVADTTNQIGINIDSKYTDDATHPNISGYDQLGTLFNQLFETAYNNSVGIYS